jgi:hypothetical protein
MRAINDQQWQRPLIAVLVALGLAQIGYALFANAPAGPLAGFRVCVAWDHEANAVIARLISEGGAHAGLRLDQALQQLGRARQTCRVGRLGIARQDYAILLAAHPFSQRPAIGSSGPVVTTTTNEAGR